MFLEFLDPQTEELDIVGAVTLRKLDKQFVKIPGISMSYTHLPKLRQNSKPFPKFSKVPHQEYPVVAPGTWLLLQPTIFPPRIPFNFAISLPDSDLLSALAASAVPAASASDSLGYFVSFPSSSRYHGPCD